MKLDVKLNPFLFMDLLIQNNIDVSNDVVEMQEQLNKLESSNPKVFNQIYSIINLIPVT